MCDQVDRLIAHYQKALLIKPARAEVYIYLAELYYNQGHLDEAIAAYRCAIELKPSAYQTYYRLGEVFQRQWQLDEAISCYHNACYRQLLESRPDFAKNYWDTKNPRHPNFLIIGAGKGGTSSLYAYLTEHPNILPAIRKEVGLSREIFDKGIDYYLSHFPPIPEQSIFLTGEATPWYFGSQRSPQKLALVCSKVKLILLLRNPVFRAFSHYKMLVNYGSERRAFAEVIASEIENSSFSGEDDSTYWHTEKGYLLLGLYFYFIEKWMAVFPREQFLILRSEDFYANPAATLTQVFEFLGVPDYPLAEYPTYSQGSYNPISDDLRQTLAEFFRPHNQKLEEYLGMKFNWEE